MSLLRDGSTVSDRRLDRLYERDERNFQFPARQALGPAQTEPRTMMWYGPTGMPVLDQGEDGACVGFGIAHEMLLYPTPIRGLDADFAKQRIYWNAQRNDPWPGGAYPGASPAYQGTSVLSGIKEAVKLGAYGEYRWARDEPELALAVSWIGPVVIGVDWWTGMMDPDAKGYLRPTGRIEGGHCCVVVGYALSGYYTLLNSWGPGWGNKGRARIRKDDMARLLAAQGDACVITKRNAIAV